jgi:hypothetical protein
MVRNTGCPRVLLFDGRNMNESKISSHLSTIKNDVLYHGNILTETGFLKIPRMERVK